MKNKRIICIDCGRKIFKKRSSACVWKPGKFHCVNRRECVYRQQLNMWKDKKK